MRVTFIAALTLGLLSSCGPSPEEIRAREQAEKDSLEKLDLAKSAAREAERLRDFQDSINAQAVVDSLDN
jgi:hypothetical protein